MNIKLLMIFLILGIVVIIFYLTFSKRRSESPYVIGQEMADAREHERKHQALRKTTPSPLPDGHYELQHGEWGLLNPAPSDLDSRIRESCSAFAKLSKQQRADFTAAVSLNEFYTLITFAKRSSVFALRKQDKELLKDALIALAMIEAKRTDYRDILLVLSLLYHTSSRIGVNPDQAFRIAAQFAEPEVQYLMVEFTKLEQQEKSLRDSWGYHEVKTEFGLGFARWGFMRFEPDLDLLDVALKIAAIIDADSYKTESIELASELPEVWLTTKNPKPLRAALNKIKGGVTISATLCAEKSPDSSSQQFTVFIVELATQESAQQLLEISKFKKPESFCMLAAAVDRLFCLVVARSFVGGVASFEKGDSLKRFKDKIEIALMHAKPAPN